MAGNQGLSERTRTRGACKLVSIRFCSRVLHPMVEDIKILHVATLGKKIHGIVIVVIV